MAEPGLAIRDAVAADRPALVGFMARLQDHERASEPNRPPGAAIAEAHFAALEDWVAAHPAGGILVAERGGRLAGFLLFGIDEALGHYVLPENRLAGSLSDLWVEPEARGQGTARALIAAAEARLKAAGIARVEVTALSRNEAAIRLYQRLAYRPYQVTLAKAL